VGDLAKQLFPRAPRRVLRTLVATELRLVLSAWKLRTDAGRVPSESVPTAARDISRCGCDWPLAAPSVLIVLAAARTARCLSVVGVL
jgi:hypothetical protein